MKIHLKQIPAEGLHLKGNEDCILSGLETDELRCRGPLQYDLEVGVSADALWANGSLTQPVELRCVSCLEKFNYDITVPAFASHLELTGPESVDLTPPMREDVLLNLPAHPRCDRDGGRTCKGAKRADKATLAEQERQSKREHDWEALDKLKLKR